MLWYKAWIAFKYSSTLLLPFLLSGLHLWIHRVVGRHITEHQDHTFFHLQILYSSIFRIAKETAISFGKGIIRSGDFFKGAGAAVKKWVVAGMIFLGYDGSDEILGTATPDRKYKLPTYVESILK